MVPRFHVLDPTSCFGSSLASRLLQTPHCVVEIFRVPEQFRVARLQNEIAPKKMLNLIQKTVWSQKGSETCPKMLKPLSCCLKIYHRQASLRIAHRPKFAQNKKCLHRGNLQGWPHQEQSENRIRRTGKTEATKTVAKMLVNPRSYLMLAQALRHPAGVCGIVTHPLVGAPESRRSSSNQHRTTWENSRTAPEAKGEVDPKMGGDTNGRRLKIVESPQDGSEAAADEQPSGRSSATMW